LCLLGKSSATSLIIASLGAITGPERVTDDINQSIAALGYEGAFPGAGQTHHSNEYIINTV
jgi:hypothetical protein